MSRWDRNSVPSSSSSPHDVGGARSKDPADVILQNRAEALARPSAPLQPLHDEITILAFATGGERYAVETRYVVEVISVDHCVPLPGAPDFLAGLLSHRGAILPAVDLGALLSNSDRFGDSRYAIVHGAERAEFGILVAQVDDVASLDGAELLADADSQRGYVRGVTRDGRIVLDGRALLDSRALFVEAVDASNIPPSRGGSECSAK